jgi:hypothetical protein
MFYKRYDAKHGKIAPFGFIPSQDPDPVTGHWPGWVLVDAEAPADKWHMEALLRPGFVRNSGTYELIGPKVQGNPYKLDHHVLRPHGFPKLPTAPRDFEGLRVYLGNTPIEGIVWHHPTGAMVKIKRRDFGMPWPCN